MRSLVYLAACTVDGRIAATDGSFGFFGFFGFNDLDGGNCVVNDFVEICDTNFGSGGL